MPEHTAKALLDNVGSAIDLKGGAGILVGTGGFFVYLTQYLPIAGMLVTFIVGIMTVLYIRKGQKIRDQELKNAEREATIKEQEIALNNQLLQMNTDKMNRRKDDPKD